MRRETKIWILLSCLTLATYLAGKWGYEGILAMSLLMLSVFIKGHFIIADFMALRHCRPLWQIAMHGWLLFVTGLIIFAYYIGIGT